MATFLRPDGKIVNVEDDSDQRFSLVIDGIGDVLRGNKNSLVWLAQKPSQLSGKNIADLLAPQSKMLATEIIVNAFTGFDFPEQPVFLYGAARVPKGYMMSGEAILDSNMDEAQEYRLLFKYDANLTSSSGGMNSAKGFADSVSDIVRHSDQDLDMTFVSVGDVDNLGEDLNLTDQEIQDFTDQLEELLRSETIEESALGQVSPGKYGLLHEADTDLSNMQNDLQDMAKKLDPEGKALNIETKTMNLDSSALADEELADALSHAVDSFVESGLDDLIYDDLTSAHASFIDLKSDRIQLLRDALEHDQLTVVYQPVVNVHEWHTDHLWSEYRVDYQDDGLGVDEIIKFTRDDYELRSRVDEQQCKFIESDDWYKGCPIALTLHIRSLLEPNIITRLMKFSLTGGPKSIILRITGFKPEDISRLSALLSLKNAGFAIALHGEELGAISLKLLESLPADYIILDDGFTENEERLKDSMPMLEAMERRCHGFGIKLVFDGILSENTALALSKLEYAVATGHYFGDHIENIEELRYPLKK